MEAEPIYLDYNATTPLIEPVKRAMLETLDEFGNLSSSHWYEVRAKRILENAREKIASLINCDPEEIIFTSSGSESNNLAIKGVALKFKKGHIITFAIEHPSVLNVCEFLKKEGFRITFVGVGQNEIVDPDDVRKSISTDTILISIMLANNEVGTIQPMEEIAKIAGEYGIPLRIDASQAIGKINVDVQKLGAFLLTVAGYKIYALKGVGILFVRKRFETEPIIHGGRQEFGLRSGIENILEIAGLGAAAEYLRENIKEIPMKLFTLKEKFWSSLRKELPPVEINGHFEKSLPNTVNVHFPGASSDLLFSEIYCSVRFSLGILITEEEIEKAVSIISRGYRKLASGIEKLTKNASSGKLRRFSHRLGCACKISSATLGEALEDFSAIHNLQALIGYENLDDGCAYKIDEDRAIVSTVDFFISIVDDPYIFGMIAVSNALGDIYAMGGEPFFGMNIVAFPEERFSFDVLREILKGAHDKAQEAGAVIIGGYTIGDIELKYGLAVNGLVNPSKILRNNTPCEGDILILTKPIGTGILSTAMKRGILDRETRDLLVETMTELNKGAPEVVKDYPVTPCTDVTGFGLIGHLYGMVRNSEKSAIIDYEKVPHIPGVTKYARLSNIPEDTYENWRFLDDKVHWKEGLSKIEKAILFDAQISGGLLFTVSENYSEQIVSCLRENGVRSASAIEQIVRKYKHKIVVR
ncbi:MAG: selenide, water dikinase SelD [Candidatus Neomarinimicrobiota bacterium]|nr:MAG: selenide, water dikinase SelD [Candidatus Neomarinimicrobiota bacterium]